MNQATLLAAESFALPANIAFGVMAVIMVFAAIRVVTTKNVVHAALWLVMVLAGIGANYLLLQAEFVAVTQIMVYIGAIVVLLLFGVMLTHAEMGESNDLDNRGYKALGALAAVAIVGVMAYALIDTFGDQKMTFDAAKNPATSEISGPPAVAGDPGPSDRTQVVSDSIFGEYLLPFELVSVLLLGALVGAIVLARKE